MANNESTTEVPCWPENNEAIILPTGTTNIDTASTDVCNVDVCPNGCGHGKQLDDCSCVCYAGWSGENCDQCQRSTVPCPAGTHFRSSQCQCVDDDYAGGAVAGITAGIFMMCLIVPMMLLALGGCDP